MCPLCAYHMRSELMGWSFVGMGEIGCHRRRCLSCRNSVGRDGALVSARPFDRRSAAVGRHAGRRKSKGVLDGEAADS